MSDLSFVFFSLKSRWLNSILSVLLTAFGLSIALLITQFGNHIQNRLNLDGQDIDIVVGAKEQAQNEGGRRMRRCGDGAPWAPCTASPRPAPPPASARAPWPAAGGSSPPSASHDQRVPCRCARCCISCPPRPRPPVTAVEGYRR